MSIPPPQLPPPALQVAVKPATRADDDKLMSALQRLCDEDPSLSVTRDDETHQTILGVSGEVHLAVTLPSHEIIGQTGVCASVTVVTPTHVYQLYEWMNTFREDFQFMASFSAPGVKHLSSYRGWLLCPAKSLYPACRR